MTHLVRKLLYSLTVIICAFSYGNETLSFTPGYNLKWITAEKLGDKLHINVDPRETESRIYGTPADALNKLNQEINKTLEANGGIIPGKIYLIKKKNGSSTLFIKTKAICAEATLTGYAYRDYEIHFDGIFSENPSIQITPIGEAISTVNEHVTFLPNNPVHKNLSYIKTYVHEKVHCADFNKGDLYLYSLVSLNAQDIVDKVMKDHGKNIKPEDMAEVNKKKNKVIETAKQVIIDLEGRAVRAEVMIHAGYVKESRKDLIAQRNTEIKLIKNKTNEIEEIVGKYKSETDKNTKNVLFREYEQARQEKWDLLNSLEAKETIYEIIDNPISVLNDSINKKTAQNAPENEINHLKKELDYRQKGFIDTLSNLYRDKVTVIDNQKYKYSTVKYIPATEITYKSLIDDKEDLIALAVDDLLDRHSETISQTETTYSEAFDQLNAPVNSSDVYIGSYVNIDEKKWELTIDSHLGTGLAENAEKAILADLNNNPEKWGKAKFEEDLKAFKNSLIDYLTYLHKELDINEFPILRYIEKENSSVTNEQSNLAPSQKKKPKKKKPKKTGKRKCMSCMLGDPGIGKCKNPKCANYGNAPKDNKYEAGDRPI